VKVNLLALLIAVSFVASCGGQREFSFSPLGPVKSINVVSIPARDGSKYLSKISDPKKVSQIIAFVDARRANWKTPWYGIPVPKVEAEFFDGQRFKGSFGAGENFFETQREGGFFSKTASSNEVREFLTLLNVDDANLKEFAK